VVVDGLVSFSVNVMVQVMPTEVSVVESAPIALETAPGHLQSYCSTTME
jgi:hypothetical protein